MGYLALSRLASYDLEEIHEYSKENWGERAALRYLAAVEHALQRLKDHPSLLREISGIPDYLKFHRVEKHFLVCALVGENVYVLTVKHGAMDLPERLGEIEPQLRQETAILHEAFLASQKS